MLPMPLTSISPYVSGCASLLCVWSLLSSAVHAAADLPAPASNAPILVANAPPEAASGLQAVTVIKAKPASGVCVTANPLATQACIRQLNAGGSAADGAIAAAWMLGLVEPQSSGLGGGGYLVYFDGTHTYQLDGRETAPRFATPQRFIQSNGQPMTFQAAVTSGLSVGTPAMVRLMAQAHQRFGLRAWRHLLTPAIQTARQGFAVSPRLHMLIAQDPQLLSSNAAAYFYPQGQALAIGERRTNIAYAKTLQQIAQHGDAAFYQGPLAQAMVNAAQAQHSDLSIEDLAAYQVRVSAAQCQAIAPYRVCTLGPSSSGGLATLQSLAMLQGQYTHNVITNMTYLTNAERLAFADRDAYVADSAFVDVPVAALLADDYLRQRQALAIGPRLAQVEAGLKPAAIQRGIDAPNTSHISVIDAQGRAASMTLSIESAFGSRIWVKSGGFLLNNQLTDFSFLPQKNGQLIANRVQAGKRPRSSMSPIIVLDAKAQQVQGVIGSPGGSQIIGYVVQAAWELMNGKPVREVLEQPHVLRRGDATELEQNRFDANTKTALQAAGHVLKEGDMTSGLAIIWRQGQHIEAGADPRREGTALATRH